ncbi:MAG: lamin tail domain-containing protein [Labilithrix sp.]|nr:lamin tail domain-containing protein [Labilithrix sp.]MCW5811832.1 lamin tail domain-containing protein [Labilithrix sp.]
MKRRGRLWAAVGIAAFVALAACSGDDPKAGPAGLDAGADARGTSRADGGERPDPSPDDDDDDLVEHPCTGKVVINELQPGGDGGAEFVELFNPTDCAISIGDWKLMYRSAADTAGVGALYSFGTYDAIRARSFMLLANDKFVGKIDATLRGGIGNAGGQVGLVNDENKVVDALGYGVVPDGGAPTAGMYTEGNAAPAPGAGESLGRKKDGEDGDDNAADFIVFEKHSAGVSNE